jgi:hypothetical protein
MRREKVDWCVLGKNKTLKKKKKGGKKKNFFFFLEREREKKKKFYSGEAYIPSVFRRGRGCLNVWR